MTVLELHWMQQSQRYHGPESSVMTAYRIAAAQEYAAFGHCLDVPVKGQQSFTLSTFLPTYGRLW